MICDDTKELIAAYVKWFKEGITLEKMETSCMIITPFIDRHNDSIVLYVDREDDTFYLTDDGYTIADLAMSGVDVFTASRLRILTMMLNGFGVDQVEGELRITTSAEDFPRKKHSLVQAILSVNDMFITAKDVVRSLFLEEVETFLRQKEIPFVKSVKLAGRSGMDHTLDFLLPATAKAPERMLQAVSRPERQTVMGKVLFPFTDIKDRRTSEIQMYAFLNDKENISGEVMSYIKNVGAVPILWSGRESKLEMLQ